jgi:hypothetical protein
MDIKAKTYTDADFQYPPGHDRNLDLVKQILSGQQGDESVLPAATAVSTEPQAASPDQPLTCTLASLDSDAGRASAAIDNVANQHLDIITPAVSQRPAESLPDVEGHGKTVMALRDQLRVASEQIQAFEDLVNRKNAEFAELESRHNDMVAKIPEMIRTACEQIASQAKPQEFANTAELISRGVELFGSQWLAKSIVDQLASLHPIDDFMELRFRDSSSDGTPYSVTVQKIRGKTPLDLVVELRSRIRLLEAMLQQKFDNQNDIMGLDS